VNKDSEITESVIMPDVEIGANCRLKKVIVDKGCNIPAGMVIGENPEEDAKNFFRTEKDVVLVTRPMIDKLNKKTN
jgi:glucose-1-phosphate adenylyltransferase